MEIESRKLVERKKMQLGLAGSFKHKIKRKSTSSKTLKESMMIDFYDLVEEEINPAQPFPTLYSSSKVQFLQETFDAQTLPLKTEEIPTQENNETFSNSEDDETSSHQSG